MKSIFVSSIFLLSVQAFTWAEPASTWKYDFGPGPAQAGFTKVTADSAYSAETGFGFLPGGEVADADRKGPDALRGDFVTSEKPFSFAVKLPEGNYNVSVLFGDQTGATETTVKAEARRLMLERVVTAPGKFAERTFTVNVRTPAIPGGGAVSLTNREKGPPIVAHWDDKLALEFLGKRPCVDALQIVPAPDAITVFVAGDSTVTDQPKEPWAGWGQMLPSFFGPGVAVANQAESGLALYSFEQQKRLRKVLKTMKRGDYLFIQFGHNDQKDKTPGAGPFTSYKRNLTHFVEAFRQQGGLPVLVTPMERRRWSADGKPQPTLADYAEAVRQVGREENVPVIDLNAMSLEFYTALGPEGTTKAFVHYPANTFPGQTKALKDDTHHNAYGAYELARCVVDGIKAKVPALAAHLRKDVPTFDPSKPDAPESFDVPASPFTVTEKPAGN
jgi:lysophospholipase L1-like esterase